MYSRDKLTGNKLVYYPNGTIAVFTAYKDGKPHGATKRFD
jgi:antitoxin component YwqK of YwqJK toxin-antitoxin module